MAGFSVVESPLRTIWMPVGTAAAAATANTLYVGQLVTNTIALTTSGLSAFVQSGTPDTRVPFGVVVGTNNKDPLYDSTYKCEYISSAPTVAGQLARKYALVEGMHGKGDPQAMVKVAVIGADTVLRGRIFKSAYGTAPTVGTVTTGAAGTGYTCSAGLGLTRIAYNSTHFCRSGANMGIYRIGYDAGTTAAAVTFYNYYPYTISAGDTFVCVNVAQGHTLMTFDALGLYVDGQAAQTASNRVQVLEIDLSVAGNESVLFRYGNPLVS